METIKKLLDRFRRTLRIYLNCRFEGSQTVLLKVPEATASPEALSLPGARGSLLWMRSNSHWRNHRKTVIRRRQPYLYLDGVGAVGGWLELGSSTVLSDAVLCNRVGPLQHHVRSYFTYHHLPPRARRDNDKASNPHTLNPRGRSWQNGHGKGCWRQEA